MAQIIFRRNAWYSDFRAGGKRIRRFLSQDKRDAQVELGKLLDSMRSHARGRPDRGISWAEFKKRYIAYSEGAKKPLTASRDRAAISAFEKFYKLARLDALTPELLERWKGDRLKDGKGKATINRDLSAMKALLNKAHAWGYMEPRQWKSVGKLKVARKKLYFHTPEELGSLLAVCRGLWLTVALLAARAGLRREEIRMLAWEDVDLDRKCLHVCPKDGWDPKDYEQRFIGLARDLEAHLAALKQKTSGRWVVSNEDGARPSLQVMSAYMRKLAKKVGLRGSLHILRHTFASHLVQSGVKIQAVKDLLGHSSLETTEIYAELVPDYTLRAPMMLPDIPRP